MISADDPRGRPIFHVPYSWSARQLAELDVLAADFPKVLINGALHFMFARCIAIELAAVARLLATVWLPGSSHHRLRCSRHCMLLSSLSCGAHKRPDAASLEPASIRAT